MTFLKSVVRVEFNLSQFSFYLEKLAFGEIRAGTPIDLGPPVRMPGPQVAGILSLIHGSISL